MFQTHTKKIGLLAIIYSFFLSFWSVYVKYVSDAKVQKFRLARSARSISFMGFSQVSCFLVCIMNKTIIYHECYEHNDIIILPTNIDSSTMCTLRKIVCFQRRYKKKIGSLASLARNHVYIFSSFQRVGINRHSIRPYIMVSQT